MKKAKALKNFISVSDPAFENRALTVFAGLNGNSYFPNPVISMDEFNAGIQQYSAALALSKNMDRIKIEEKNVLRKKLEAMLTALLNYVNYVAEGNRTMLLSTGFDVSGETSNTAFFVGEINNVKVIQGSASGEIVASFKRITGRRAYVFCYGEAPIKDDYWKVGHSINPGLVINGLLRGKEYVVRVGVIGPQGQAVYAAPVNIIVP